MLASVLRRGSSPCFHDERRRAAGSAHRRAIGSAHAARPWPRLARAPGAERPGVPEMAERPYCDFPLRAGQWAILPMMSDSRFDPLLLGQRLVAILERGHRTATYKLATLMALIDYAIEHVPEDPGARVEVPIPDLAHRVLELYWRQVRPFGGKELRQSTQSRARIPSAALDLRAAAQIGAGGNSLAAAATRAPRAYRAAVEEVALCLAQQPLYRLQRLPGATASDCFLYDDSFLHPQVSRRSLRVRGDAIVLNPGVATGLAKLAGLLKPALEIMWVEDVRRMNRFLDEDVPDVAGHLFGRERIALAAVREPLKDAFGARCFYCNTPLSRRQPR